MKTLLTRVLLTAVLCSATLMFADTAAASDHAVAHSKPGTKKSIRDNRSDRARRQIIEDLRLRGSNVPAALSSTGKWTR